MKRLSRIPVVLTDHNGLRTSVWLYRNCVCIDRNTSMDLPLAFPLNPIQRPGCHLTMTNLYTSEDTKARSQLNTSTFYHELSFLLLKKYISDVVRFSFGRNTHLIFLVLKKPAHRSADFWHLVLEQLYWVPGLPKEFVGYTISHWVFCVCVAKLELI